MVQRHAPFLKDQEGLVAVAGQRHLDDMLVRLVLVPGRHPQPPRGLALVYPSGAFPAAGKEVSPELTAQTEVALDLAEPAGETAGIGERRPRVVDVSVEAVLHPDGALAVR